MEELLESRCYVRGYHGRAEYADVWYVRARARAKIWYRKYFIVSIIQGRKYLVIFTFAVLSDYKNSSTMKISGFMVEVKNCVACGGVEEILVHNMYYFCVQA